MDMATISLTLARTAMANSRVHMIRAPTANIETPMVLTTSRDTAMTLRMVLHQCTKTRRNTSNTSNGHLREIWYRGMSNDSGTTADKAMGLVAITPEATPYRHAGFSFVQLLKSKLSCPVFVHI
jgi:hypothetical protein